MHSITPIYSCPKKSGLVVTRQVQGMSVIFENDSVRPGRIRSINTVS